MHARTALPKRRDSNGLHDRSIDRHRSFARAHTQMVSPPSSSSSSSRSPAKSIRRQAISRTTDVLSKTQDVCANSYMYCDGSVRFFTRHARERSLDGTGSDEWANDSNLISSTLINSPSKTSPASLVYSSIFGAYTREPSGSEDAARASVRMMQVMLWKLLTLAVARRCALTGVGPTGTPYTRSFVVVRVHTFQNRRTPYGDTSVVRVHTSGSSQCLARRRAETNRIKSLRPPTHRDRRHRDRHRRFTTTTRPRDHAFAIPTTSPRRRRPHETRQSIKSRRVHACVNPKDICCARVQH